MSKAEKNTASKEEASPVEDGPRRVASPRMKAGPCPRSPKHSNTEIYKTVGRVRRCKCNDCGHTWKLTGPFADELREYAYNIADALNKTERVDVGEGMVVMIPDSLAKEMEGKLRELATT